MIIPLRGHHLINLYLAYPITGNFGNFAEGIMAGNNIKITESSQDFFCSTCKKSYKDECNTGTYKAADNVIAAAFGLEMDKTYLFKDIEKAVKDTLNKYGGDKFWRKMKAKDPKLLALLQILG